MRGQYFPLVPGSHIKYLGGAGLRHAQLTGATIIGTYCKFIGAKLDGARFIHFNNEKCARAKITSVCAKCSDVNLTA